MRYDHHHSHFTSYTSGFPILLALSNGERHGYGIMKQVESDSQGNVSMGAGTLYGSLKRMLDSELVNESDKRVDPEMDDERRIYYQITGVGAKALAAELERYKRIVTLAQEKSFSQKPMVSDKSKARALYKRLIAFYPRAFKEQHGESMEQTFNDLCNEKRQTKQALLGFVLWTFIETAIGIFREHRLLISSGVIMQTIFKTLGSPALISLLIILPFMIMEVLHRRNFNEDFPFVLFFGLWLNLFAISLILLPIVRARRTGKHDMANPVPTQGNTLLTNPKSALMISVVLILSVVILSLLVSLGWEPLERLLNDPNPEQLYVFRVRVASQLIALVLFSFPIAAGIIAGGPIVSTLRARGSLFAHPINLIIVVVISFLFATGIVSLIVDQWPCFMGVPNCD